MNDVVRRGLRFVRRRVSRNGRGSRRGRADGQWNGRSSQSAVLPLRRIKKADLKWRQHFYFMILRDDDLLDALDAREPERVARIHFRGRSISLEIPPFRLRR